MVKWYKLAAGQGNASEQANLGNLHDWGTGVPQDHIAKHMWYNIAASKGADGAPSGRDAVAGKMQAVDVSEAQRRART